MHDSHALYTKLTSSVFIVKMNHPFYFYNEISVKIHVEIGPQNPFSCKRQNWAVLYRVTAGVARERSLQSGQWSYAELRPRLCSTQ